MMNSLFHPFQAYIDKVRTFHYLVLQYKCNSKIQKSKSARMKNRILCKCTKVFDHWWLDSILWFKLFHSLLKRSRRTNHHTSYHKSNAWSCELKSLFSHNPTWMNLTKCRKFKSSKWNCHLCLDRLDREYNHRYAMKQLLKASGLLKMACSWSLNIFLHKYFQELLWILKGLPYQLNILLLLTPFLKFLCRKQDKKCYR